MNLTRNAIDSTGRGRPRRRAAGAALAALLLVVAACGSSSKSSSKSDSNSSDSSSSGSSNAAVLGTKNVAKGTPIKIGFISDGKSDVADYSIELQVAPAAVKYQNEYKGGIAGHPIQLVKCETHVDPAKTADCANQLIQDDVVAVLAGELSSPEKAWQPLHDAHIPYVSYNGSQTLSLDKDSTFLLLDSLAALSDVPIQVAKDNNQSKVTAVIIDLPAITVFYKTLGPGIYEKQGMKLAWVAIPPDQADMTPQMQTIVSGDPGVVQVLGGPTFCTAAFNALRAVGYKGKIVTIGECLTADVFKAVPGDYLKGTAMFASAPVGDTSDPDVQLYLAVIDTYAKDIDKTNQGGYTAFGTVTGFARALEGITGDITPASIIATMKAMPEKPMMLAGGLKYRCNGKAVQLAPAICVRGALITTLGADGQPTEYKMTGSTPIEN